eukprot:TRINITY_DN1766_c0_g1_i3.p1 TRINITY_DN1766_c0_g1~~TRINITY_DN1766_c0_g1_i3.p1  ORF type:complete len:1005 (-),score=207.53 TRINITY_DN1766_c0_g1_i3:464-3355(-)
MATPAVDSSSDHFLQLSSLPVVDLRLFSQSELTSLSLCSDPCFDFRRSDDVVDPKIDRSIFNESAGSRKQTYSRLRLARRPSDSSSAPGPRRRRPPGLLPDDDAAERRSNDHIVFFLRKLFAPSGDGIPEPTPPPSAGTRKANSDRSFAVYDNGSEILNRNGVVVDVPVATGRCEDPFAAEVRRRTEGLRTKEELIGFLEGFEGQWGSNRRKKRFVDAGVFCDVLPKGWRIMLSLKRRGGRAWLICRKYISPNGQQFESFKEVSSYLLSLFGPEGSSLERSAHIDKSSQLPTQSTAGLTFKDDIAKDAPVSYSVIPISSSAPMFSVSTKHENQVVLFNAEIQVKTQQWNTLECDKCKLTFNDKDLYVEHLSFHRKKPRKFELSKSISDGVIIRDGKYECQFCHKTFDERRRYNGHVGIHVKYYGKTLEALPDDTAERENNDKSSSALTPSASSEVDASISVEKDKMPDDTTEQENNDKSSSPLTPSASSEVDASVNIEKDKMPETSTATFNNELNSGSTYSKQPMDTAIVDSPKCSALEINQEMSSSKSVDEHELTNGSLLDPVKNSNAKMPETSTATFNDEIRSGSIYSEQDMDTAVVDNPKGSAFEITHEMSTSNSVDEHEITNGSLLDPVKNSNANDCKVELCLGIAAPLPTNEVTAICDLSGEKDLCLTSLFGETSELGNKRKRDLGNCSITHTSNKRTCAIETCPNDIFTSIVKEPMLCETATEKVCNHESSYALSDYEKICGTDQHVERILASNTKEPVLDKSEKSKTELESGISSSHPVSDEVVRAMVGSSGGENLLLNTVADTSSLLAQQSSFLSILDSDTGADKSSSASQKLEKVSDFEELRLDDIETTKFDFVTGQDSGSLSDTPMDLTYMVDFEQGLDNSIQFEWDSVLPKMVGGNQFTGVCGWCRVEFNLGNSNPEMYPDSVFAICPNCKAKSAGQFNALDNGFSMNSDQL